MRSFRPRPATASVSPHKGPRSFSPKSPAEHMGQRRDSGLSLRNVAKEFGVSHSTIGRKTKSPLLSEGFMKMGPAK